MSTHKTVPLKKPLNKKTQRKQLPVGRMLPIMFYVILVLLVIIFLISGKHRKKSTEAAAEGQAYITAEMTKDPAAVQAAIQGVTGTVASSDGLPADGLDIPADGTQAEAAPAAEEDPAVLQAMAAPLYDQINNLTIPELSPEEIAGYQQKYANTIVIGDSMAQAVYEYGLLDGNHVYFERGASISMLSEEIDEAMAMLPSKVIFFTGLNDTDYFEDPNAYAAAYQDRINQVLSWNPTVEVYICSMTPPSNELGVARPDLARAPEYDAALQNLCASTPYHYIDLNWIVRQELYLEDGIHFDYSFYTVWLQYAAMNLHI